MVVACSLSVVRWLRELGRQGKGREGIERREGEGWKGRVASWIEGLGLVCTAKLNCSSGMVDRNLRCLGAGNQAVGREAARALSVLGTYGVD